MKIINILLLVIIGLLSIAAGAAKIMQVPEELEFLQSVGLSVPLIMLFGAVQIIGGLMLIANTTRVWGALLVALGFLISSILIFTTGDYSFAAISLIPVALAVMAFHWAKTQPITPSS